MEDIYVVTGGGQGIGGALAKQLARSGKAVALLDVKAEATEATANVIRAAGGKAFSYALDVTDQQASFDVAREIESDLGRIVGLVTCAGTTRSELSATMSLETWKLVIDINLTGTFLSCQAFAQGMLTRGCGSIVTIASVSGTGGQPGRANYVASKWGVIGLTKTLAIEWGNRGVRVNSIAPGPVNTALYAKVPEEFREGVLHDRTPLKRAAEPDEIANAVMFLLSDQASYINGAMIPVDGGYTAGYATRKSGADTAT